jgi:hypothetical protein
MKIINYIVAIGAFVIAYALFKYLGLVGLLFIGMFYLDQWFSKWYLKREGYRQKII